MVVGALSAQEVGNRALVPRLNKKILLNGLNVLVAEHRKQPTVTLNLMVKSGATFDPVQKAGLAAITTEALKLGARARTSQEIAQDLQALGATIDTRVGWDATYIIATASAKDFDKILSLLSDIVIDPAFPEQEFSRLKERQIAQRQQNENPDTLADEYFNQMLFDGMAYAHPIAGTVKSLSSITLSNIKDFYKKFYVPNNTTLAVVGDVNAEDALKKVSRKFGVWVKGDTTPFTFLPPRSPAGTKIYLIDRPDLPRSHIRIGHLGITRLDDDYFSVLLMNQTFGGEGSASRLATQPHWDKGVTASSRLDPRRMPGPFAISIAAPSHQTPQVVSEAIEVLRRYKTEGPTQKELDDAKKFYIGYYPSRFETNPSISADLLETDLYQLGANYINTFLERVQQVSLADVKRAAEKHLEPNNLVVVVVGKAEDFRSGLEKIGQVKIISPAKQE